MEITLLQVLPPIHPSSIGGRQIPDIAFTVKESGETEKEAIDYLNKFGEALRSKGATVKAKVAIGDASEEIINAAEETNTNLIAMSTHGRSGLSRWAFGSVTDKVLRRGGMIPIVMVKAPG